MNDASAERKAEMAREIQANPHLAPPSVIALGYQVSEFLLAAVADPETSVDTGCGMGDFDCWVKIDGIQHFVTIRLANSEGAA